MHDEPHLLDQSKAFKYHTFVLDVWCSKLNLKRKSLVYHIHIHIHFIWDKAQKANLSECEARLSFERSHLINILEQCRQKPRRKMANTLSNFYWCHQQFILSLSTGSRDMKKNSKSYLRLRITCALDSITRPSIRVYK